MRNLILRTFGATTLCVAVTAHAGVEAEMVRIPAGEFTMGSNKIDHANKSAEFGATKPWYMDEHPLHTVKLAAYWIDKYEVTNAQYRAFMEKINVNPPEHWMDTGYIATLKFDKLKNSDVEVLRNAAVKVFKLDMDTRTMTKEALLAAIEKRLTAMDGVPVVYVNWHDAQAYCAWAGKRLPSEAEWEKAARGTTGKEFPWGNKFRSGLANVGEESWEFGVSPGGSYKTDKSPYGVYDLAGNVREWVNDWYQAYPGAVYQSADFGETNKVVRGAGTGGGSGHYALSLFQRAAYRGFLDPASNFIDVGFRCAKDAK